MKNCVLLLYVLILGNFAFAQSGAIAEMKLSSSVGASGTFKITVGAAGTRVEMHIGSPQMPGVGISTTTISKSAEPGKSYLVNESNKTYSVHNQVDESANETVDIVVLGNEKIGNYNCVHIQAKNNHGNTYEMWNSKEVINYAGFSASMAREKYTGSAALQKALAQKGAEGFPVKATYKEKEGSFSVNDRDFFSDYGRKINMPEAFKKVTCQRQQRGAIAKFQ